ncbi:unnamed protein product [Brassica oleracea var. botrytis]|uniref:(rape) hypothetical protein n=1 Tax=Brassica napus TaxID=3708 RepID=A0A816JG39_BRANA|nr:unnamed protein product [Brassica napus]
MGIDNVCNLVRRLESATIIDNQELRRPSPSVSAGKGSSFDGGSEYLITASLDRDCRKFGGGRGTLVAMTTETGRKKRTPQILKTDTSHTALKLAEKWVANMTTPAEDEPEQEVRTHGLGLGAKVSRQMKRRPSDDPLDQKLQAKFDAGRRKHARTDAQSASASKNAGDDTEDDDDESESKSQAFGKKRQNRSTRC